MIKKPLPHFYVTGGTMKLGAESYIVRKADDELYRLVLAGEFCYVLTARQMGKSSLMARTAERLNRAGVFSVQIDLTMIGSERSSITADEWYYGVAHAIQKGLGNRDELRMWWLERDLLSPGHRFSEFIEDYVLRRISQRIVIFVDEIDFTIGMDFCNDFFANIRAIHNARASKPAFSRLTFVLLGVANPAQLISDPSRTPFNIGHGIELKDFSPSEAEVLSSRLSGDSFRAQRLLRRILHWTGGYPYLTQVLCRSVAEVESQPDNGGTRSAPEDVVDRFVQEQFLAADAMRSAVP